MTDLPARILAAIEADEAMARRILPYVENARIEIRLYRDEKLPDGSKRGITETVTPYDPARVLARCHADRDILALHVEAMLWTNPPRPTGHCETCGSQADPVALPCPTLRALAAGYGIESEEEA